VTVRPKLTAENVVDYLDWLTSNLGSLPGPEAELQMRACELVVRTRMGAAQAKDTQHTLVRDGIIDPPPTPQVG
jgi:hypothetical protein